VKIVVIGGVAAGMSAAARAKRKARDAEIIVFEQGDVVSFGACGLPYYAGGWFDDPNEMIARTAEQSRESGIDVRLRHRVVALDHARRVVRVVNVDTGEEFEESFDQLLIAVGAEPVRLPAQGMEYANVTTLTTLTDGERLRTALKDPQVKNVAVVGAGFIGLETVEACVHTGKAVRLIEMLDGVLADAFDREIAEVIEKELVANGVQVQLSEKVSCFEGDNGSATEIVTDNGRYPVDLVVVAAGVRPATGFLAESGINMLPNGAVIVDHHGATNLEGVFAAGDCATVPLIVDGSDTYVPLATGANKLGRVIGDGLAGIHAQYPGSLASACVKVLGAEAGRTGLSERQAERRGLDVKSVLVTDKDHTSYWPGQSEITVKLVYHATNRTLLGGQIVGGQGAVLRTDVLAAAITGGMTVDQLGMLDLCYAPPFARTWDVLNIAGNVAK